MRNRIICCLFPLLKIHWLLVVLYHHFLEDFLRSVCCHLWSLSSVCPLCYRQSPFLSQLLQLISIIASSVLSWGSTSPLHMSKFVTTAAFTTSLKSLIVNAALAWVLMTGESIAGVPMTALMSILTWLVSPGWYSSPSVRYTSFHPVRSRLGFMGCKFQFWCTVSWSSIVVLISFQYMVFHLNSAPFSAWLAQPPRQTKTKYSVLLSITETLLSILSRCTYNQSSCVPAHVLFGHKYFSVAHKSQNSCLDRDYIFR